MMIIMMTLNDAKQHTVTYGYLKELLDIDDDTIQSQLVPLFKKKILQKANGTKFSDDDKIRVNS